MEKELKNGKMVQNMQDNGLMIKPMVMENYFMLMEIFMKENG